MQRVKCSSLKQTVSGAFGDYLYSVTQKDIMKLCYGCSTVKKTKERDINLVGMKVKIPLCEDCFKKIPKGMK